MAQDNKVKLVFGLLFIVIPIMALLFGDNEPAMQTEQAPFIMTFMIIMGIIMIADARKEVGVSPPRASPAYVAPVAQTTQASKFCPYCGAAVSVTGAKYCAGCGSEISEV